MKWQRIVLVLITLSLLVVPLAWSQGGNAEQQAKEMTNQHITALMKADTNSLEILLADDYTGIRGDGTLSTKAQEIGNVKSGTLKTDKSDIKDLKIRVYGHTAVVTALTFFKGTTPSGTPFSGTTRSTRVWVKQKGNWNLVSFQATRVPSGS
jgi:ketosteroid isomerase-like protein